MRQARGQPTERGSVLMLVPAGGLVLVVLGAIAVDAAVAFLGQRELSNAAAAAANDAAAAALSDTHFYRGGPDGPAGTLAIDVGRARAVANGAVRARTSRGVLVDEVDVTVGGGGRQVCVTVQGRVPFLFGRALPFIDHEARVTGRAGATAVPGNPSGAGLPPPSGGAC